MGDPDLKAIASALRLHQLRATATARPSPAVLQTAGYVTRMAELNATSPAAVVGLLPVTPVPSFVLVPDLRRYSVVLWSLFCLGLAVGGRPLGAATPTLSAAGPAPLYVPAHTVLSSATPPPDSTVQGAVRELRLVFSTAVQPALSTIVLTGPDGRVATGPLELVPGEGERVLRLPLAQTLPDGAYVVEWVTAGSDSHPINGSYGFGVDAPERPTPPAVDDARAIEGSGGAGRGPDAPRDDGISLLDAVTVPTFLPALTRWLLDATALALLGLAAFRWLVLERLRGERWFTLVAIPAMRRIWVIGWAVAVLQVALLPLRLGVQATQLFGTEAVARSGELWGSLWGTSWWLHLAATLLLAAGLLVGGIQGRRAGWAAVAVAALLVSVLPALSGHASGTERLQSLMVLNHSVHVAAAGAWVGGLLVLLVAGLPAVREAEVPLKLGGGLSPAASLVAAFSAVAVVAVAVLIFTGVVNARVILGSWQTLFGSLYGAILMWKLGFVALTGLLGLYHWLVVRPQLEAGTGVESLRTTAKVELGLAVLVLTATALLATTIPEVSA